MSAARAPAISARGRKRNGELNRIPSSSMVPATTTKAMSMIQGSLGSFFRVSV
jgi:hypothetical protein